MAKAMSQLESQNGELQEKSRAADDARRQLERELLQLQNTLDTERRTCSQGSEEIRQLQGTYRAGRVWGRSTPGRHIIKGTCGILKRIKGTTPGTLDIRCEVGAVHWRGLKDTERVLKDEVHYGVLYAKGTLERISPAGCYIVTGTKGTSEVH